MDIENVDMLTGEKLKFYRSSSRREWGKCDGKGVLFIMLFIIGPLENLVQHPRYNISIFGLLILFLGWEECENYRILDDAYRSSSLEPEAGEGLDWGWCDKLGGKGSPASPNWLGEGWYRYF